MSESTTVTVKTISPRCGARLSRDARLGAKSKRYFRPRNPIPASAAASGNSDLSLSRAARAEAIWSLPGIRRILLTHNLMLGALVTIRRIDSRAKVHRSEEHTSELQSLMRISYAVFCLKKTIKNKLYVDERSDSIYFLQVKHTH